MAEQAASTRGCIPRSGQLGAEPPAEEVDQPVRRVVVDEAEPGILAASTAAFALRANMRLLVLGERGFEVASVRGDGLAELGAVVHREVGALTVGRHQMRGVAEQSHAGHALPPMSGRERMDRSGDGVRLAVGDQRGELWRPAVELRRDSSLRRLRVGEVDARDPLLRLGERDVGVQDAVGLAVGEDALAGREGEHGPVADGLCAGRVARVGVEQVRLDERGADVLGLRVGQQRPDPRPGAVRADHEARGHGRPVREASARDARRRAGGRP